MVLHRALAAIGVVLIVGWGLAVTAYVLGDENLPADTALGVILATAVVPGFIGLCVIGLLWPVIRALVDVSRGAAIECALICAPQTLILREERRRADGRAEAPCGEPGLYSIGL